MTPTNNREQRRRATRLRIAQTGFQLFLARGYEETTLDAIAAAAGISRRTFFSYFKSKDEILLAIQAADWDAVWADLRDVSPDEPPLAAVHRIMARHLARYESEDMRAVDRVMRASETLMNRKHATYAAQEQALYATLCEVWRQPQRRPALRMVAMAAIGAMRIALETWGTQTGQRPLSEFLDEAFAALATELAGTSL